MAVTIYKIAERAGVSSSTVARVLRGDLKESWKGTSERAAKIRRIAEEMGYQPNLRARAFSRGKTHGIGLLYTDDAWIFEGVNSHVINSFVRELRKQGYHLVFVPVDSDGQWQEVVRGGQVDGCITLQSMPDAVRKVLKDAEIPMVVLGDNSDLSIPYVTVDDHGGAFAATKHLLALEHRRIAMFVHESIKSHCSLHERRAGFEAAMDEASLDPRVFWRVSENEVVDAILRGNDRPTALLCYCDLEATMIVHAMWQYGIQIPNQLSVVGFNDLFATQHMTPPLTSVAYDTEQLGVAGVDLLLKQIDSTAEEDQPEMICLNQKLNVRGSTALCQVE